MSRSVASVVIASLALTACSHKNDYRVHATERCLEQQGLDVGVLRGNKAIVGLGPGLSFMPHGAVTTSDKAPRGAFLFVLKGNRVDTVLRRLKQAAHVYGPPFSRRKFAEPRRNVIPAWSSAADAKFKATAESCLTK